MITTTEIEKYSTEWWGGFLVKTKNLTETSVFKDCMVKQETKLLRKYILQIIQTLAKLRTNKYGYRVYIDGKLLDKAEMSMSNLSHLVMPCKSNMAGYSELLRMEKYFFYL